MLVLGIESTCDETGCAVVREGKEILANVVASQVNLHRAYGGVVPELACRRHIDVIIPVINEALEKANTTLDAIDLIAVAYGPGLIGALLIGLNTAKTLAFCLEKPFIGINHVEAHLYAAIMSQEDEVLFPCLGVVLSGGHTSLVVMEAIGVYHTVGNTVDDAVGEAFDKVAKILGLPYPGGPEVEKLAREGDPYRYSFKAGRVKKAPLNFSFSGLKTSVLYTVKGQSASQYSPLIIDESDKKDIAASFQEAAFRDIVDKALRAAEKYQCRAIALGGGVTNNRRLRQIFEERCCRWPLFWPEFSLTLDNAAMIAGLGYHRYHSAGGSDPLTLEAAARINLSR